MFPLLLLLLPAYLNTHPHLGARYKIGGYGVGTKVGRYLRNGRAALIIRKSRALRTCCVWDLLKQDIHRSPASAQWPTLMDLSITMVDSGKTFVQVLESVMRRRTDPWLSNAVIYPVASLRTNPLFRCGSIHGRGATPAPNVDGFSRLRPLACSSPSSS